MRQKWKDREKDLIFQKVNADYRPLQFPVKFSTPEDTEDVNYLAISPLPGGPNKLRQIAQNLRSLGKAFISQKCSDLPERLFQQQQNSASLKVTSQQHIGLEWHGWKRAKFALEMQSPWARLLLDRKKTIETRAYLLPTALLNTRIGILESKIGVEGKSSVSDVVQSREAITKVVKHIGWFKVASIVKYDTREKFENDVSKHLVESGTGYSWKDGCILYGWVVSECGYFECNELQDLNKITRRMRSLFEIELNSNYDQSSLRKIKLKQNTNKRGKVVSDKNRRKKKRY